MKKLLSILLNITIISISIAADQPQWGQPLSRNMVSDETELPDFFDPATGKNIKWVVPIGTKNYGMPIIANGKVFIGTNNEIPRDPKHTGDRGILLCLNENDGTLCWQLVVPKLGPDKFLDWPEIGIVSPPTIQADRVYVLTNRVEVLCLDIKGQVNGNDGPFKDEARYMVPQGTEPIPLTKKDADIIWKYDLPSGVGIYPHDSAYSSILLHGDYLYLNTCNGVDNTHKNIPSQNAPSLIVLDKNTGKLIAVDNEHIGPRIFHSTWSSPALGKVNGKDLVFFCGGDGVCYAFETPKPNLTSSKTQILKRVWRFDPDPDSPKENIHQYSRNRTTSPSNIMSMPVFHNNRLYVTVGGDIWWGKHKAWLKCIDATQTGDITKTAEIWSFPLSKHSCSTPAIYNGMVFVADCGKNIYCLDVETGKHYWTHEAKGEIWASPIIADGKIYTGTRNKHFWILAAQKQKKILHYIKMPNSIAATPTPANNTLYLPTMKNLYAIKILLNN
jgi:outer membrane protein assembly factor BamB